MSIMRVFWGQALTPPLAALYHNLRAIPVSQQVYVGWDTPVEWLNGAITNGVSSLVSEDRIANFIANYALLDSNYQLLLDTTQTGRSSVRKMKDMESNVVAMKSWLIDKIGPDWRSATNENRSSKLDMPRGTLPWVEVETVKNKRGRDSVALHVGGHVRKLTDTFFAFSD